MDPTNPARSINRRLLLSIHQDGLLDVLAGMIVITFGMIPILDQSGLNPGLRQIVFLSFYFLEVFIIIWLKKRITLPRTGLVELSRKTRSKLAVVMLLVNILLFLIFVASLAFDIPIWKLFGSYQLSIPLGLIFLIMFTVSGALLKASRYFFYGIIVFAAYLFFEHLYLKGLVVHHGIPLASFTSGGCIVVSGVVLLIRFMRTYKSVN